MLLVLLKLGLLAASLAPVWAGLAVVWRVWWRRAGGAGGQVGGAEGGGTGSSEVALAAAVCVPLVLLVEIVALDRLAPVTRPLDHLLVVHLAVALVGATVAVRGRRELAGLLGELRTGIAAAWREARWPGRAVVVVGLTAQATATLYGAWNGPVTVDEKAYHVPQAIQPYQDGRLGPVQVNVEWADSHPRGGALLYFWTLRLAGTDAGFHPVNGTFGFVLLLATYAAGRRAGLPRGWSAVAAGIVPVSPIMFYLSTVGNIDLSVSGLLGCAVAFALPRREGAGERGGWDWPSCAAMLAALLLALWMKLTPLPLALLLVGVRGLAQLWAAWRRRADRDDDDAARAGPGPLGLGVAGVVMLGLAFIPYAQTWERYGSPTYPFTLQIGPVVVFDGPMDIAAMMNRGTELSVVERFWMYWSPRTEEIGTEVPGQLGPVFAMAMIPAALACAMGWWRGTGDVRGDGRGGGRGLAWLILGACFWSVLVIPEHHVPRYAVWTLLPGAVCVARIGAGLWGEEPERRRLARSWCLALLVLQGAGCYVIGRTLVTSVRWQVGTGLPLLTELRNRTVIDEVDRYGSASPTPATRRALYELMRPGETLVTAVDGLMGLFWDPRFSYRVEHRPARRWPKPWPELQSPEYGAEEAPAWLEGLRRDGVAAAMVYQGSAEDVVLSAPHSGYHLVFEQPPEDGKVVRIYRRTPEDGGGGPAPDPQFPGG